MVDVLVILDGASEPIGSDPTSLERAHTPALDQLGRSGALVRLRTVAPGLPAGSETAIAALLGWTPPAAVDRGALEAAARDIRPAEGERAWRIDVRSADGGRAAGGEVDAAKRRLAGDAPGYDVHRLGGHRLLLVGPPPRPPAAGADDLHAWPEGIVPPRMLGEDVVMIAARGAAAGLAALLGATVVVPAGATGRPGTDLDAKARAALDAIRGGVRRIVVHVGAPDEAAHERDGAAKVAAIEDADARLVAPLAAIVDEMRGTLTVCPDHGCDPVTGLHHADPVPCLTWPGDGPHGRLTERAVADLPATEPQLAVAGTTRDAATTGTAPAGVVE